MRGNIFHNLLVARLGLFDVGVNLDHDVLLEALEREHQLLLHQLAAAERP